MWRPQGRKERVTKGMLVLILARRYEFREGEIGEAEVYTSVAPNHRRITTH
jgi:hypothetical protein